ncbi:MAG: cell division protease FtsH [Pirellulaceae bacterium]|jgi:cell division protease FtsH
MDPDNRDDNSEDRALHDGGNRRLALLGIVLVAILLFLLMRQFNGATKLEYSEFLTFIDKGNVAKVLFGDRKLTGEFKTANGKTGIKGADGKDLPVAFYVNIGDDTAKSLETVLIAKGVDYDFEEGNNPFFFYLLFFAFPLIIMVFFWISMRRSRDQMMGGGFLSGFSKSPAKKYDAKKQGTTFDDVAGLDGVKADLTEIVEYLKDPKRFQRLGGRVPKGVLLNGPPGTGKTLLARAVAGEAGVPFYSVNGSEFIQMFVGVGASRVRDLFKNAKDNGPAIIFIDEIDAVGRQRGAGLGGGHDEREQTLNQILSEMDGFNPTDSVIVMAATNRPDVLDPALLRPGRFDRHVSVNRPTRKGRLEILKVHVRDVPLDADVKLDAIAGSTAGLTGAGLENLVNEAALWAARHNKSRVSMEDFDYARDKVLMGAKREEVLSEEEKEKTAYHEAGHTIAAWTLPNADQVYKVTVIPRGQTLGATQIMPTEDRINMAEQQLNAQLIVLLAGRAAEKQIYNELSVGAENDLERATSLARRMVTHWGMSEKLGPVSYKMANDDPFLGREIHQQRQFSERTMELIDAEVSSILREAEKRADELLANQSHLLEKLTRELVKREELDRHEIRVILGPSIQEQLGKTDSDGESESDAASGNAASSNAPSSTTDNESPQGDKGNGESTDADNSDSSSDSSSAEADSNQG